MSELIRAAARRIDGWPCWLYWLARGAFLLVVAVLPGSMLLLPLYLAWRARVVPSASQTVRAYSRCARK